MGKTVLETQVRLDASNVSFNQPVMGLCKSSLVYSYYEKTFKQTKRHY